MEGSETMRCPKCGFEASIWEWKMVESQGFTKIPDDQMKEIEKLKDSQKPQDPKKALGGKIAFTIFKAINKAGMMPYHATEFICPKCGWELSRNE
jgi:DNA-directed RNA polymerase subunit M/transcription elongation factor TFIIS